jgi:hypothetical protein
MVAPGQTVIGLNGPTVATGFTKAIICIGDPEHEDALGVMVYVTFPTAFELFESTWLMVFDGAAEFCPPVTPAPFAAIHVKVVPAVVELKAMLMFCPLQTVSLLTKLADAIGEGFTVIV